MYNVPTYYTCSRWGSKIPSDEEVQCRYIHVHAKTHCIREQRLRGFHTCLCIYYPESDRNYCSCKDQMGLTNLDSLLPRCPYPCHICQFSQTISCQLKITLQLSQEFCRDISTFQASHHMNLISKQLLERT